MYFDPAAMVMTLRLSKVKCGEYDLFFEKVHFGTLTYAYRHVRSWGSSSVGVRGVTTKKIPKKYKAGLNHKPLKI